MASTPITELDFDQIVTELKSFLQAQGTLQDYDYEGSTMAVLLDVLGYNTFMNNFYTNMAISELFLDSAQLRSSVISHAKELNYLPRSYRASQAKLTLSFSPPDTPSFISIPKYTKFNSTLDGVSYTFSTDETYTLVPTGVLYQLSDVFVYEGRIEREYFNVTSTSRYVIANQQVDTNSIKVRVYQSSAPGADSDEYIYSSNLFGVTTTDKVFFLQPTEKDRYEIVFGQDAFGRQPVTNEVIEVTYRISSGEAPNGATSFSADAQIGGYTATVTTQSVAESGAANESLESIKFYAPKSIQIQERAVTESDYEILLKNRFSEIQAVSVFGGEELDPPKYGRVIVAVDVKNAEGVSENSKEKFRKFLRSRCPLSIEPILVSPEFLYVRVVTKVFFDFTRSATGEGAIQTTVRNAVIAFSDTYLNDFKKDVRASRIARAIDDSDQFILSNDTTVQMILDLSPQIGEGTSYNISYNQKLLKGHPLYEGEDLAIHTPAVRSSPFTYLDNTAFLFDNGLGVLQILTNASDGFKILDFNAGTVDYETGKVVIRDLNVQAYDGSAIKLYGLPFVQDVFGPKDKIVAIRGEDVDVEVFGETTDA